MALVLLWTICLYFLISTVAQGTNDIDVLDAVAGERFIIRTWRMTGSNLSINVTKGYIIRLNAFLDSSTDKHMAYQKGQLILTYNHTSKEATLILDKVSREYEGLYQIEECFYRNKSTAYETETEACKRKYSRWSLELNVLETHEVIQGNVGEKIIMKFRSTFDNHNLYNYGEIVAHVIGSVCGVLTDSYLYGRLRCTTDVLENMQTISIDNVTQRDAGLYKLDIYGSERCFVNITDKPIHAVDGENIRIGWFYNQQGMNRTLLVIHPNQEVMMLLPPTTIPQIKRNFQHRLLYGGDTTKSFLLFTLLNVRQSDAGLYTIETIQGNTIPGSRELIVEEENTTHVQRKGISTPETVSIPIYLVPVVIVAVIVLNLMVCCLVWIWRKKTSGIEADTRSALEGCDRDFYITPVIDDSPLPIPFMNDRCASHSNTTPTEQFDSSLGLLHRTPNTWMEGYEMVDMSK